MTGEGQAEALVIGGGVIGLSIAYELLRRGRPAVVLEWGEVAGASTPAAAGMLAPVSEAEEETPGLLPFALESLARFPDFVQGIETLTGRSCGYRTDGTLWVAVTRDDQADLDHLAETLGRQRLPFRRLTAEEALELEPHLSGRVLGGLLVERDLQVDPRALASALSAAVERLGGRVERGVRVEEIVGRQGRVAAVRQTRASGPSEVRDCGCVVLAAGAWSTSGIASPLRGVSVRPVKGQILRLRGEVLVRHVIRHPEVYLVPRSSGELVVGATIEEMGFDTTPTAGAVYDLLRSAWRVLPAIYDIALEEISVGFRPVSLDNRPVLGGTDVAGLYVATGHGRQGILLAPATAHHLAELIVEGRRDPRLEAVGHTIAQEEI